MLRSMIRRALTAGLTALGCVVFSASAQAGSPMALVLPRALSVEGAKYVAHLKTMVAVSLAVKWSPAEVGSSRGTLTMPVTEAPTEGVQGTFGGGPLESPMSFFAASLWERFSGGARPRGRVRRQKGQDGEDRELLELRRPDRT
jgi:hypothetical protein